MVRSPIFTPWMNTLNREDDPDAEISAAATTTSDPPSRMLSPAELERMIAEDLRARTIRGDHPLRPVNP